MQADNALLIATAVVLSIAFDHLPGVNEWFAQLTGVQKRLAVVVGTGLLAAAAFGLSCQLPAALVGTPLEATTCTQEGFNGLLRMWRDGFVASQIAFVFLTDKKPSAA